MSGEFFANYKEFIRIPIDKQKHKDKEFDPRDYASHYILTLSLNDSLLSNWREAHKYEIEVGKSIKKVLEEFNKVQEGIYHLQLLELEDDKSYFVLSLSCKTKVEKQAAEEQIVHIIEKVISNPFYVGQSWFRLIGDRGRINRKLFCFSFIEYKG